jgi:hypothetical protein
MSFWIYLLAGLVFVVVIDVVIVLLLARASRPRSGAATSVKLP